MSSLGDADTTLRGRTRTGRSRKNEKVGGPSDSYICHICNIDVPTAFSKEHNASRKHKANASIMSSASERMRAMVTARPPPRTPRQSGPFCAICNTMVNSEHNKTATHRQAVRDEQLLSMLANLYCGGDDVEDDDDDDDDDDDSAEEISESHDTNSTTNVASQEDKTNNITTASQVDIERAIHDDVSTDKLSKTEVDSKYKEVDDIKLKNANLGNQIHMERIIHDDDDTPVKLSESHVSNKDKNLKGVKVNATNMTQDSDDDVLPGKIIKGEDASDPGPSDAKFNATKVMKEEIIRIRSFFDRSRKGAERGNKQEKAAANLHSDEETDNDSVKTNKKPDKNNHPTKIYTDTKNPNKAKVNATKITKDDISIFSDFYERMSNVAENEQSKTVAYFPGDGWRIVSMDDDNIAETDKEEPVKTDQQTKYEGNTNKRPSGFTSDPYDPKHDLFWSLVKRFQIEQSWRTRYITIHPVGAKVQIYVNKEKLNVPYDNFHSFNREERKCLVCTSYVDIYYGHEDEHIASKQHMSRIMLPVKDSDCFRKMFEWFHCILCNDTFHINSEEQHRTSAEHNRNKLEASELNQEPRTSTANINRQTNGPNVYDSQNVNVNRSGSTGTMPRRKITIQKQAAADKNVASRKQN